MAVDAFPARAVRVNFTACIYLLLLLSNTRGRSATAEEGNGDIYWQYLCTVIWIISREKPETFYFKFARHDVVVTIKKEKIVSNLVSVVLASELQHTK